MPTEFMFYNSTKIYFGQGCLEKLGKELLNFGKKIMLVRGQGSIEANGLYNYILDILHKIEVDIYDFKNVEPNPRHTTVNRGAEICRLYQIDAILAVGGGSVIDCAKGIAMANFYEGDCWDLIKRKRKIEKTLPIITIPTTASTGSEMNCSCVISNAEINQKRGFSHPALYPKVSFLDPVNTFSVNAFQTACGSVDIMAHVFDVSYFVRNKKMYFLNSVMEDVLKTVVKYAPIALKEPTNYEARANLMWVASWGLNGFLGRDKSTVPTCHYMEHELSAYYNLTHGVGLAILIPKWMRYILDLETSCDFARLGVNVFGIPSHISNDKGANLTIEWLEKFFYDTLNLPSHLRHVGIEACPFSEMANSACWEGWLNGYKTLSTDDVINIYKMCL